MLPTLIRRTACSASSSTPTVLPPLLWTYLPSHLPYQLGLILQETLVQRRLSAKLSLISSSSLSRSEQSRLERIASTDILFLLQHSPVYTAGKREKDPITAEREGKRLGQFGADYVLTGRGGQTTFHGPGQLVGYPLIDLGQSKLSTRCYVDRLEKFLESLVKSYEGVPVYDLPHTGVFCSPSTKIASIGVQIRRRITMHGFSINLQQQTKEWFDQIVACGLEDVKSTSVEAELRRLGRKEEVSVDGAIERTVQLFGERYGREMRQLKEGDEHEEVRGIIRDGVEGKLGQVKREMMGV